MFNSPRHTKNQNPNHNLVDLCIFFFFLICNLKAKSKKKRERQVSEYLCQRSNQTRATESLAYTRQPLHQHTHVYIR